MCKLLKAFTTKAFTTEVEQVQEPAEASENPRTFDSHKGVGTKHCPWRLSCEAIDSEKTSHMNYVTENIEASIVLTRMVCEAKGVPYNHENLNKYRNMAIAEVRGVLYETMRFK